MINFVRSKRLSFFVVIFLSIMTFFLVGLAFFLLRGPLHMASFEKEPNDNFIHSRSYVINEISSGWYGMLSHKQDVDIFSFRFHEPTVHISLALPITDTTDIRGVSAVVVGPGLPPPSQTLPFSLPEGDGVMTFDVLKKPISFFHPFSFRSWTHKTELTFEPPKDDFYFVVIYDRFGETGQYAVLIDGKEPGSFQKFFSLVIGGIHVFLQSFFV